MVIYTGKKPSKKEKEQLKIIHKRILELVNYPKTIHDRALAQLKETALLFPTEAHIFLFRSFKEISKNNPDALNKLIHALRLQQVKDVIPFVWEALLISKDKWVPAKNRKNEIDDPDKILNYVRSIAWRLYNKDSRIAGDALFYGIFPFEDFSLSDNSDTDIDLINLWIDIERVVTKDKAIKENKKGDIIDLLRARIFQEATRDNIHQFLNLEKKDAQALWRDSSRKEILKKIHLS